MTNIDQLWSRIEAALSRQAPEVLATLGKPAKLDAIAKLEAEFGLPLPDALKSSWARHDGQNVDDESLALFVDFPFFSIKAVRAERKEMLALAKSMGNLKDSDDLVAWAALVEDGVGSIEGPVKARDFHPKWLPICSVNGDVFRYLDFDPAPGGEVGQVIEVDPEGVSWRVVARSFAAFLERFADALDAGKMDWDEPDTAGSGALFPRHEGLPAYLVGASADEKHASSDKHASESLSTLESLKPGGSVVLQVEVSRIIGGVSDMGIRLDLSDGRQVWADATKDATKGYKQIKMRARGTVSLERLPGKKLAFRLASFKLGKSESETPT